MKEPKFEIKPLEPKPAEKEPEPEPEVEVWEGEGGAVEEDGKEALSTKPEQNITRRELRLTRLKSKKEGEMERLRLVLKNLDAGEPIEEFRDKTRRVIYFDEERKQYFTEENGQKKYLGIGDILSDYAWDIKYAPTEEMTQPAYRALTKRILTNEARRNIEHIYDRELAAREGGGLSIRPDLNKIVRNLEKNPRTGFVAEVMVKEILARVAANFRLKFSVTNANIFEDNIYKYDFKIRTQRKSRGVDVEGEGVSNTKTKIERVGFQLKVKHKTREVSRQVLGPRHYNKGVAEIVDEVLILTIRTNEIDEAFKKWLKKDRPSGGPEQFLSSELKKAILKAVTEKLVDIPQEVFDKIE